MGRHGSSVPVWEAWWGEARCLISSSKSANDGGHGAQFHPPKVQMKGPLPVQKVARHMCQTHAHAHRHTLTDTRAHTHRHANTLTQFFIQNYVGDTNTHREATLVSIASGVHNDGAPLTRSLLCYVPIQAHGTAWDEKKHPGAELKR